jgi:alpha/beta superfamily hydrolase
MEIFYFGPPSHRLFGVLERPTRKLRGGLVFCPPSGEEMISTYARLARWSKELSKKGFAVLRFHPFGTCESDGTFADFTLEGALQDTATAVGCLRERTGVKDVGIFGLRFGGFVAAHAASEVAADFLVLWSPITDLQQYFRDLLRVRLTAELVHLRPDRVKVTTKGMVEDLEAGRTVDILGYEFSPALYRQMTAGPSWPKHPTSSKILWLSRVSERRQLESLGSEWMNHGLNVNLQFLPESPFWEDFSSVFPEKFAAASEAWLAECASP